MIQRKYHAEIDGLRAVAVLGVLLFHFEFSHFSGGFTGVDIFFVISGFLITQNILNDLRRGTFSFGGFYVKRMRRLFPALFVTLLLTTVFGYLLFTPEHYERLGKSLGCSVLSVSNFFFWKEAGYFDTATAFKPLLHTWSLSVEEQFYLIWPTLLFFLVKFKKNFWLPLILILGSLLSLYFAEKWLASDPEGAFFLTPFRIVEFAIGAVLVWFQQVRPKNRWIEEILLLSGFCLIFYSFFAFDKGTSFPGLHALIPCAGAALAIYSGKSRFIGLVLRNPLATGIGLISYSLYLVHWPLLIFYKYWKYSDLTLNERLYLFAASFLLAVLSYKFIEQPFRKGLFSRHLQSWRFPLFYSALATVLLAGAAVILQQEGFPQRISSKFSQVKDTEQFHVDQYGGKGYPFIGNIGEKRTSKNDYDTVLAGDSFMLQYVTGLDQLFQRKSITAAMITDYACIIGPDITFFYKEKPDSVCTERNQQLFNSLKEHNKPLILSLAWEWYIEGICDLKGEQIKFKDRAEYYEFMIRNVQKIREKIGWERQLIIIGNSPGSGNRNGVISCLNRPNFLPNKCLDAMIFEKKKGAGAEINRKLAAFAAQADNTRFINPFDIFCDQDYCYALDFEHDKIWYSDGGHLSIDGSVRAADYFGRQIVTIITDSLQRETQGNRLKN